MSSDSSVDEFLKDQERCRISSPRIKEALKEALSRVPDSVYDALVHGDRPLYVVESNRIAGIAVLGCAGDSGMSLLTLSRELDGKPPDELVGIMAHELAHLALGHQGFIPWKGRQGLRLREDLEADDLACQWGFKDELASALEALRGEQR